MERPPLREVVTTIRIPLALTPPVRALEGVAPPVPGAPATGCATGGGSPANRLDANLPEPSVNAPISRRDPPTFEPLTADVRRMHLTVSKRFETKVAAAKDALSHARPGATTEEILEAALDLLIERAAKRKGVAEKPRKTPRPAKPAHIPAHVKRAVLERDGGRCQFVLPSGEICGATRRLEFDHVRPLGLGGASTVENVRVRCRPHNLIEARRVFGNAWMDRYAPGTAAAPATSARASSP